MDDCRVGVGVRAGLGAAVGSIASKASLTSGGDAGPGGGRFRGSATAADESKELEILNANPVQNRSESSGLRSWE